MAAGATQTWTWNNANPLGSGYKVGFSPVGASTTAICQFGVERSWYSQRSTGERRFHFVIKNTGTLACGATVLLAQATGGTIGTTGWLAPGASEHWYWNIHDVIGGQSVQLVGLSPIGAVGSTPCQLEVVRTWNAETPSNPNREFHFVVRNVGSLACAANLTLASVPVQWTSFTLGNLAPGQTVLGVWNNANPLNAVYVPRISNFVSEQGTTCELEPTPESYVQRIASTGAPMRQFYLGVRNIGPRTCLDLHVYLPTILA